MCSLTKPSQRFSAVSKLIATWCCGGTWLLLPVACGHISMVVVVVLSKQHLRITIQTACRILGLMWISIYAPLHPHAHTHLHKHTHTHTHTRTHTHSHTYTHTHTHTYTRIHAHRHTHTRTHTHTHTHTHTRTHTCTHTHTHTHTHTRTHTHTHTCNTRSQRKRTSGKFPSKTFVSSTSSAQVLRGPCLSVSTAARRLPSRRSKTLTTPKRSGSCGSSVTPTSSNSSKPYSLLAFHVCPVGWEGNLWACVLFLTVKTL